MENLTEKVQGSNDSALIKSLSITFPNAKVQDYGIGFMLKITTDKVDLVQFRNLVAISNMYNRDVEIIRSRGKLVVTLSEREEANHV